MYICMRVCIYMYAYIDIYIFTPNPHSCPSAARHRCVYTYKYNIHIYIYIYIYICEWPSLACICLYIRMYTHIYICTSIFIYVCVYICIYICAYLYVPFSGPLQGRDCWVGDDFHRYKYICIHICACTYTLTRARATRRSVWRENINMILHSGDDFLNENVIGRKGSEGAYVFVYTCMCASAARLKVTFCESHC